MSSHSNSNESQLASARETARTAAHIAIGGTALAADKAIETVDHMFDRAGSAARERRREMRETAESTARKVRKAIDEADSRPYEERTRDELYALAAERDIHGRSNMRKAELIRALRAQR